MKRSYVGPKHLKPSFYHRVLGVQWWIFGANYYLGGWTSSLKHMNVKIGIFPQFSGWTYNIFETTSQKTRDFATQKNTSERKNTFETQKMKPFVAKTGRSSSNKDLYKTCWFKRVAETIQKHISWGFGKSFNCGQISELVGGFLPPSWKNMNVKVEWFDQISK